MNIPSSAAGLVAPPPAPSSQPDPMAGSATSSSTTATTTSSSNTSSAPANSNTAAAGLNVHAPCGNDSCTASCEVEMGGGGSSLMLSAAASNCEAVSEWFPPYPRLCAYHDVHSLAAAWGLGPPTTNLENTRPTGASQAQSPSEDDLGDGKSNELLASCPAFRNELGVEPIRRVALSRQSINSTMSNMRINTTAPASANTGSATASNNNNPLEDDKETWHREHTASEAGVLEDVSNVYLGGRLCAARQPKVVIEPQDIGSYYFRHCFASRAHVDYFGIDESLGPVAVSMVKETSERKEAGTIVSHTLYRLIIRISDILTMRVAVPEEALNESGQERSVRTLMRELLELVFPQIHFGSLRPAIISPKVDELLLKIDEQPIYTRYKVGVLYCRANQSTEEQMYNNETSSPAFEEFLDFLGQRVRLKGFDSYKGGLDTRGDTTGEFSVYTEYISHEVMFHISTMLPFTQNNKQQLSRKRHIGNDMVTIIFQDPDALPFSPITVRSHFQHVFIVVRVSNPCTDSVSYGVAVSRAKDVPAFGPPIRRGATYQKSAEFHDFLLTKIINAENAVHRSRKFAAMAARTRREALKELAENYITTHSNDGPSRIASRFLGGSVKRKERHVPRPALGANIRGALSWMVEVTDHSLNRNVKCVLGVSADSLVLMDIHSGSALFATPTHSILGWANTEIGLKIYYDHGDMLLMRCCNQEGNDQELRSLLKRLEAVTNGEEAKELILRKQKPSDSLGFHVQEEGVVVDVDMYRAAWKVGLRQGSRIVEMENVAVAALSFEQMTTLLDKRCQIRVMMISPASDGNPRRGCEDPNCPAVKGQEVQILTPDTFAKQPLTYQEMFKIKNKESKSEFPSSSFDGRLFNFSSKSLQKTQQEQFRETRISSSAESHQDSASIHHEAMKERKKFSAPSGPPIPPRNQHHPHQHQKKLSSKSIQQQERGGGDGIVAATSLSLDSSPGKRSTTSSEDQGGGAASNDSKSPSKQPQPHPTSAVEEFIAMESFTATGSSPERHLSFDDELSKYQWLLQKSQKEKRELELLNEQLKTQLAMEQREHQLTRRQLESLQEQYAAEVPDFNAPEGDEEL